MSIPRPSMPLLIALFLAAATTLVLGIVPQNVLSAAQAAAQTYSSVSQPMPTSSPAPAMNTASR
jgi:hypothetical protein